MYLPRCSIRRFPLPFLLHSFPIFLNSGVEVSYEALSIGRQLLKLVREAFRCIRQTQVLYSCKAVCRPSQDLTANWYSDLAPPSSFSSVLTFRTNLPNITTSLGEKPKPDIATNDVICHRRLRKKGAYMYSTEIQLHRHNLRHVGTSSRTRWDRQRRLCCQRCDRKSDQSCLAAMELAPCCYIMLNWSLCMRTQRRTCSYSYERCAS